MQFTLGLSYNNVSSIIWILGLNCVERILSKYWQWPARFGLRPCPHHCLRAYTGLVSRLSHPGLTTQDQHSISDNRGLTLGLPSPSLTIGIPIPVGIPSPSHAIRDSEWGFLSGIPDQTLTNRYPDPNLIGIPSDSLIATVRFNF